MPTAPTRIPASRLALGVMLAAAASLFFEQATAQVLIKLEQRHVKWGPLAYGTGAAVTYTYLREPLADPDARNCRAMVPLDQALAPSGVSLAAFDREVRAAFALWGGVADLQVREVQDLAEADIVIGAQATPRGIAYVNVTLGERQSDTISQLTRATVCLNPEVAWTPVHDGDAQTYHLRRVMAHEIGHALGLDHDGPEGGIMGYRYIENARTQVALLSASDIAGIQTLYGPTAAAVISVAEQAVAPPGESPATEATAGRALRPAAPALP